jgi:pimeloyl-ACP methyl ester carboxylesterase
MPPAPETRDDGAVDEPTGSLAVRDQGRGFPVVFLHGQPGGAEVWEPVQALLAGTGVRTLALDRPGYGTSSIDAGGFRHNADALTEVLAGLGRPAVVVAHSWAAGPALLVARRSPELLAGLVLCAPVGDPGSVTLLDRWLAHSWFGRFALSASLGVGAWLVHRPGGQHLLSAAGFGHLGHPDARSSTRSGLDARARRSAVVEQMALVEELVEVRRAARGVHTPTIVLGAASDTIVRPSAVKGLARAIPHARLRMLEGGHLIPAEHSVAVADAVLSLVATARGGRRSAIEPA